MECVNEIIKCPGCGSSFWGFITEEDGMTVKSVGSTEEHILNVVSLCGDCEHRFLVKIDEKNNTVELGGDLSE
jgi:DNA-directed RNA polymerase subunit RPC12/RpoP